MKKMLSLFLLFAVSLAGGLSRAQLVGVDRHLNSQWILDDKQLQFGNLPDVACEYDTNQTHDALVCGLSADSERLILTQKADMGTNFGLSDLNTPGLTIMDAAGTKNITIYHDGTNGIIDVSSGVVSFPDGIDLGSGNMTFGSSLVFEGATADAFETTLTVVDPTADRTVSIPDSSGTVLLSTSAQDAANSLKGVANGIEFEGATADAFETTVTVTDPTADRTITIPDLSGTVLLSAQPASVSTLSVTTSIDLATLTQADLTSSCTLGQLKLDTGGSTIELCYCRATNTWVCTAMTAGPTD